MTFIENNGSNSSIVVLSRDFIYQVRQLTKTLIRKRTNSNRLRIHNKMYEIRITKR